MPRSLTIAGGGLAGLSLAIALRQRDVPVTLHEAGTYPRHRVCGEFLSGVQPLTLQTLGIDKTLSDAVPLASACWHDPQGMVCDMMVHGLGLSRHRLDDRLRQQFISLGGRLVTNSRIVPGEGTIWAAGRPRRHSPWIGLKCHATDLPLTHDLEMFLGANGYLGLARIEEDKVNVCGLFKNTPLPGIKGPRLLVEMIRLGGLYALARRLEAASWDESSFCGVAAFETGRQPSEGFSIGDATHLIPPLTGNGMSMAFESAECALPRALDYAHGHSTWSEAASACANDLEHRFAVRMAAAGIVHRILTSPRASRVVASLTRSRLLPLPALLPLLR